MKPKMKTRVVQTSNRLSILVPGLLFQSWYKCQYNILLLTFKVLHGPSPQYLSELLKLQVTERDTRQTDTNRLHQPVMNTRTFGDRAFVAAVPTLWNSLPVKTRLVDSIDTFKKQTKTHLFPSSHK